MNPKLLALLLAVGGVTGGVAIYQMQKDVGMATLADAGLGEGQLVALRCRAMLSTEAVEEMRDAGDATNLQGRYGLILARGRQFPDGVVMPDMPDRIALYGVEPCDVLTDAGVPLRTRAVRFRCACRRAVGTCTFDGAPAQFGVTLPPGWTGIGCQPKPCVEIGEESSWPSNCPDARDAG